MGVGRNHGTGVGRNHGMGVDRNHEFHPLSTELFLDEIFDAAAPLQNEHELLVVRGSGVPGSWVDGHQD